MSGTLATKGLRKPDDLPRQFKQSTARLDPSVSRPEKKVDGSFTAFAVGR
jgi:hypothetical protein